MDPWGNSAKLSREDIIHLQNRRLRHFLSAYLYPFSPHYQKLFDQEKIDPATIRRVEDLARIPFTSKLDLVDQEQGNQKFRDFILQPDKEKIRRYWPARRLLSLAVTKMARGKSYLENQLAREFRPVFMTFTTGTTNTPVPFLYSNYDIENLHVSGARMLNLFDIDPSDRIVSMFPYAPHLAFWQVVFAGLKSSALILSSGGGKVMGTEGNISIISRIKPSVLLGVPSFVYHVLRVAREKGCRMDFIKKVVLGASKVTVPFKIKLAEILEDMGARGVAVLGTYGFTEARAAWAECPTALDVSSGYHLYPDKGIFEVVDPKTGEAKGEGEDGELVYTAVDARASVVMRYRTGDFAKGGITYAPCPHCRRTAPRISSDITRLSDVKDLQLSKIKGSLVNLNNFSAALSDIRLVDEWQIEIRKKDNDPFEIDELVVYACQADGAEKRKLEEEIREKILSATELAPNLICFVSMDEMVKRLELETANKEKRIVDRRPK